MPQDLQLERKFYKNIVLMLDQYLVNTPNPENASLIIELLLENAQFKLLADISPTIIAVLDHKKLMYPYFSKNVSAILGYEADVYTKEGGFEFAISTLHPQHAQIFSEKIVPRIIQYYDEYSQNDQIHDFRFTNTFMIRRADGTARWFMQHIHGMEQSEGFPLYTSVFLTDIHEIKKDNFVDFIVYRKDHKGLYQPIEASAYESNQEPRVLTKRELEILDLVGQGKSSADIADLLFLSVETVANHRKNMLKKMGCNNSTELLKMAIRKGYIH